MSEKRFGILEAIKSRPYVFVTAKDLAQCYVYLAEVAEAVEVLQRATDALRLQINSDVPRLQGQVEGMMARNRDTAWKVERLESRESQEQKGDNDFVNIMDEHAGRLEDLEAVTSNEMQKQERMDTELADLRERIAALERHTEEDHAGEVQP